MLTQTDPSCLPFWGALMALRPLPCDMRQGATAAVLSFPKDRLALVVVPVDALPSEETTLLVQLRDMSADGDVVVDVLLGDENRFLRGSAYGAATDEIGAAEALSALMIGVGPGQWDVLTDEVDDDE